MACLSWRVSRGVLELDAAGMKKCLKRSPARKLVPRKIGRRRWGVGTLLRDPPRLLGGTADRINNG